MVICPYCGSRQVVLFCEDSMPCPIIREDGSELLKCLNCGAVFWALGSSDKEVSKE